jgi:hypothetical protein
MNKLLLIGGGIAIYFLFFKPKKATTTAPPALPGSAESEYVPGQAREAAAIDAAIDKWIAEHPGEPLPEHLHSEGIRLGLII